MVDIKTQETFSEVYAFLNIIGEEYRNKIPKQLMEMFSTQKSAHYNPIIDPDIPIEEQNLKKDTLAMIAMLDLNYWCETEQRKQELTQIFIDNQKKHQEELREKYNPNDIFKNNTQETISDEHADNENTITNDATMVIYKEPVMKRIINK